jgi:hypothetical protein
MQMDVFNTNLAFPSYYRVHEVDLWVKRAGQAPVQVYGIENYMIVMGTGVNKFGVNPPAYSEFKPTGYGNVWDNQQPIPTCAYFRFADIIFSQGPIPWPED